MTLLLPLAVLLAIIVLCVILNYLLPSDDDDYSHLD